MAFGDILSSFSTASANPYGVAVEQSGNIWFTDADKIIRNVEPDGTPITSFPTSAFDVGAPVPYGITVAPDNNLWISAQLYGFKIYKVTPAGVYITSFEVYTFIAYPLGIASQCTGALYITDLTGNMIHNVTTSGQEIASFSTLGYTGRPVRGVTVAPDGRLFVVVGDYFTSQNNRIFYVEADGTQIDNFIMAEEEPLGIAMAPSGNLFAVGAAFDKIYEIESGYPLPVSTGKIKFFYANSLADLTATSTDSPAASPLAYDVANLIDKREINYWKAADTADQYITFDSGSTYQADYIAVAGHNLASIGAKFSLQYSATNIGWGCTFEDFTPTNDKAFVKEFGAKSYRYWRVIISGASAKAFMAICIWGLSTELDYASVGFDPYGFKDKPAINKTQMGYVAGVHHRATERAVTLKFNDADSALEDKIKSWRSTVSVHMNFFFAWDISKNPGDVYLMRPDVQFNNPLTRNGLYQNNTLKLRGRLEA